MKKTRLLCLILGVIMLASFLAGCSSERTEEEIIKQYQEDGVKPVTVSLWIPTNASTTKESVAAVENEINKILKSTMNTAIELHAVNDSEYEAAVKARIAEIKANLAKGDTEASKVEYEIQVKKVSGGWQIIYPEVYGTQLDLFMVRGYDNYKGYIADGALTDLTSVTGDNGGFKIFNQMIFTSLYEMAKENGALYALPTNTRIGEYTLLVINKALANEYGFEVTDETTLTDCADFIKKVGEAGKENVIPFTGDFEASGVKYFSADDERSILASLVGEENVYKPAADRNNTDALKNKPEVGSVLDIKSYTDTLAAKKELSELGYIGVASEGKTAAVSVVSGMYEDIERLSAENYVIKYENPELSEDDVYGAMFGVSKYSSNSDRALKVLEYLYTEKGKAVRMLLQYGIEETNYKYTKAGNLEVLNDDYSMNVRYTGNVYMTTTTNDKSVDIWEGCKKQNLDSVVTPYFGVDYVTSANETLFDSLKTESDAMFGRIDAMTFAEFAFAVSVKDNAEAAKAFAEEAKISAGEAVKTAEKAIKLAKTKDAADAINESVRKANESILAAQEAVNAVNAIINADSSETITAKLAEAEQKKTLAAEAATAADEAYKTANAAEKPETEIEVTETLSEAKYDEYAQVPLFDEINSSESAASVKESLAKILK